MSLRWSLSSLSRLRGGTHPLAVGPANPGLLHRPGRSDRQRRWVPGAGPGRQIDLKTARTASADSEVRPGPRPQTLRPYQAKTSEAGPEAQSTSSLSDSARMGGPASILLRSLGVGVQGHWRHTEPTG